MRKVGFLVIGLGLVVSACGSSPLSSTKALPDETVVVDAPPLTLPPRFDLRPPREGGRASEVLLRQSAPIAADPDDAWLVKKAGAVDPDIRSKLAEPVPTEEKAQAEETKEAQDAEQHQKDESFWNIWGGWKPGDEDK